MEKTIGWNERFTAEFIIKESHKERIKILLDDNGFAFLFVETYMRSVIILKVEGLRFSRIELLRKLIKQLIYD